jgi:hypothetical protein
MRWCPIALAVLAGFAAVARAQPAPPPDGEPAPPPPTPPPTPPPPNPPVTVPEHHEAPEYHDLRPHELSIGIGVGYTFSTSLETPNTVSVRLRLPSGLAFEPIVRLRNVSHTTTPVMGNSVTDQTTELGLAANVLIPIWHRGRADFDFVAQLAVDTDKVTPDTTMGDTNKVTTTAGLGYGIEVGFWISRHWMVSMTATNPIVQIAQTSTNAGGASTKDSTTTIGLIHDPTVAFVIHLFN